MKRSRYTALGSDLVPQDQAAAAAAPEDGEGAGAGAEEEGGAGQSRRSAKEEVDGEAYDDTDFYQLLFASHPWRLAGCGLRLAGCCLRVVGLWGCGLGAAGLGFGVRRKGRVAICFCVCRGCRVVLRGIARHVRG